MIFSLLIRHDHTYTSSEGKLFLLNKPFSCVSKDLVTHEEQGESEDTGISVEVGRTILIMK